MKIQITDEVAKQFATLMIKKITTFQDTTEKRWLKNTNKHLMARNIQGRYYTGMNALMLSILVELNEWKTAVFMTFKQAQEANLKIKKGSCSFPIYFCFFEIKNKATGEIIGKEEYDKLCLEDKKQYGKYPKQKKYNVFNIEQTNFSDVQSEDWIILLNEFSSGEYQNKPLNILEDVARNHKWVCPIKIKSSDQAFYSPLNDIITIPLKSQFMEEELFDLTLLHEMAHSTGHVTRLDRPMKNIFGSSLYAKEELIAELSAALTGQLLNASTEISAHNITYLQNWLEAIRETPMYIMEVLKESTKAANYILNYVKS